GPCTVEHPAAPQALDEDFLRGIVKFLEHPRASPPSRQICPDHGLVPLDELLPRPRSPGSGIPQQCPACGILTRHGTPGPSGTKAIARSCRFRRQWSCPPPGTTDRRSPALASLSLAMVHVRLLRAAPPRASTTGGPYPHLRFVLCDELIT